MRIVLVALALLVLAGCGETPESSYSPERLMLLTDEQFERLNYRMRAHPGEFTFKEQSAIREERTRRLGQELEELKRLDRAERMRDAERAARRGR